MANEGKYYKLLPLTFHVNIISFHLKYLF